MGDIKIITKCFFIVMFIGVSLIPDTKGAGFWDKAKKGFCKMLRGKQTVGIHTISITSDTEFESSMNMVKDEDILAVIYYITDQDQTYAHISHFVEKLAKDRQDVMFLKVETNVNTPDNNKILDRICTGRVLPVPTLRIQINDIELHRFEGANAISEELFTQCLRDLDSRVPKVTNYQYYQFKLQMARNIKDLVVVIYYVGSRGAELPETTRSFERLAKPHPNYMFMRVEKGESDSDHDKIVSDLSHVSPVTVSPTFIFWRNGAEFFRSVGFNEQKMTNFLKFLPSTTQT